MTARPIRVLVVDDSITVRRHLCAALAGDPGLEVVAEAGDGAQAIVLCDRLRPDVITMDIMLPQVSGLAATAHIMAHCPTPILVVSSASNRGELFNTFDALTAGAVDVLDKPHGDRMDSEWERELIAAVNLVARIPVMTHPGTRRPPVQQTGETRPNRPDPRRCESAADVIRLAGRFNVIAIGASTGGPAALATVLRALPTRNGAAVLIVQHIADPFGVSFAEWLGNEIGRPVTFPRDRDSLVDARGRIVMAPPEQHLEVHGGRLRLTHQAEHLSCRPSVDVLFESLAKESPRSTVACLLTGMGRDGAQGLLSLRRSGAMTMAQDEATAVVYGMPREAALIGAAQLILPLHQIGPTLSMLAASPATQP